MGTRRIPLGGLVGKGKFAIVDSADYDRVMRVSTKWHLDRNRNMEYVRTNIYVNEDQKQRETKISMHRVILGPPRNGQVAHHYNDNGLDNRRENLCICSNAENQRRQRMRQGGSSKFRGVSWDKKRKRWRAHIRLNGQQKHLGYLTSEIEAAKAYNSAAKEHFGKWARLNEI